MTRAIRSTGLLALLLALGCARAAPPSTTAVAPAASSAPPQGQTPAAPADGAAPAAAAPGPSAPVAVPGHAAATSPAAGPDAPVAAAPAVANTTDATALEAAWHRLDLRLPPSNAQRRVELTASGGAEAAGVLIVAGAGIRVDGAAVGATVCRTATGRCPPGVGPEDATLRLPLDDLQASVDTTVHRAVVAALRARWRGKEVWMLLDRRLTGWASLQLIQSVAAAGATPVLVGASAPGVPVRHWSDERPPAELAPGRPVPGAEAVPSDVYAVVVEVNVDGSAVVLAREGGGMMRRPCGTERARCAARVSDILAARPDLATLTLDFGHWIRLGELAAWVEALRDSCVRDAEGSCTAERTPAIAVLWVRRGGAEWTDGDGDPKRAGEPPVPVQLPEVRPRPAVAPATLDPHAPAQGAVGADHGVGALAPSAAGAGLDLRGLAAPSGGR